MELSEKDIERYAKVSSIGDKLLDLKESGSYKVLDEHIFKEIERGAFEAFKRVKPDETVEIIQTQMMAKIVDKIRCMIDAKIEEGKLAKQTLIHSTREDE